MMYTWYEQSALGWNKRSQNKKWPSGTYKHLNSSRLSDLLGKKVDFSAWVKISDSARYPSHIGSDTLGNGSGVFNPADGNIYDSKSAYHRAVKSKGLTIIGDQEIPKKRSLVGDFDCRKEVAQAIEQTGFMDKIKPKRKKK